MEEIDQNTPATETETKDSDESENKETETCSVKTDDMITFCDKATNKSEDFYIISKDKGKITALAKYNLMVGSNATDDYAIKFKGLQTKNNEIYPVAFAKKNEKNKKTGCKGDICYLGYWGNSKDLHNKLLEEYGNEYPADVYDENSILWQYLESYKKYFNDKFGLNVNIRLITYDELINNGCSSEKFTCTNNNKQWIYSTNYWSASASDYYYMWYVRTSGRFNNSGYFFTENRCGVRPVIEIEESELQKYLDNH